MPKEALQGCFINKRRSAGKKVTISDMEIAQIKKPPPAGAVGGNIDINDYYGRLL